MVKMLSCSFLKASALRFGSLLGLAGISRSELTLEELEELEEFEESVERHMVVGERDSNGF